MGLPLAWLKSGADLLSDSTGIVMAGQSISRHESKKLSNIAVLLVGFLMTRSLCPG